MSILTSEQEGWCHGIIHTASAAAGGVGAGLAQIPIADNAIITPIQVGMIFSLGQVIGVRVDESIAKGIIAGMAASFVGRGAAQLIVGWIPGLGNAINTTTAAVITEAVGWAAVEHFKSILSEDHNKFKKMGYEEASKLYEKKFKKQAEKFQKQKKIFKEQRGEYTTLLKMFAEYKIKLENDGKFTEINEVEETLSKLKNLKVDDE